MNNLNVLIEQIKSKPETVEFQNVIDTITEYYDYTATQFRNGSDDDYTINQAGENEGSCKIFSFALLHNLDEMQTLNCFGHYYRNDVLNHQENSDHANIRHFMKHGWKNITFKSKALRYKHSK